MTRQLVSMAVAMAVALAPMLQTGVAYSASRVDKAEFKAGTLTGKVANDLGESVDGVSVRVIRADGATVAESVSDMDGKFVLKSVTAGEYTLVINESIKAAFKATDSAEKSEVTIVLPGNYSAGQEEGGLAVWLAAHSGWVIVVAIVGGVLVYTATRGDDGVTETFTVSP